MEEEEENNNSDDDDDNNNNNNNKKKKKKKKKKKMYVLRRTQLPKRLQYHSFGVTDIHTFHTCLLWPLYMAFCWNFH